jgi:hypothetical protein
MQPVPCIHCGYNYMRRTTEPDAIRLCNSCEVREQQRNPKGEKKMETIDILIKCPNHVYRDIEEYCINKGTNPSDYLLKIYYSEYDRSHQEKDHKEKTKEKKK